MMETIVLHPLKRGIYEMTLTTEGEEIAITFDRHGNMFVYGILVATWAERVARYSRRKRH